MGEVAPGGGCVFLRRCVIFEVSHERNGKTGALYGPAVPHVVQDPASLGNLPEMQNLGPTADPRNQHAS